MAIKGITQVKGEGKYYNVDDFASITKLTKGVFSKRDKIYFGVGIKRIGKILKNGVKPIKIFTVHEKLFVCTAGGEIYVQKSGELNKLKIPPFNSIPKIYPIKYDGKDSALIISDGMDYIVNDTFNYVGVPNADTVANYKDGIFFGYKRKIYACLDKDYTRFNVDFTNYLTINIPAKLSCVKKLIPFKDCLLAVCANGFAQIKLTSDEMRLSFTPIDTEPVKIEEDTVVKIGDTVYFLSRGKLCVYDGGKVYEKDTLLDGNSFTKISVVGASGKYYLLPGLFFDGEKGLYVYDVEENKDAFLDFGDRLLSEDGTVLDKDGNVGIISFDGDGFSEWQSVDTDFDQEEKKTLYQLYVKCFGDCVLTLTGDKRTKTFNLKEGGNLFNVNLYAQKFNFNIRGEKTAFPITGLKVKYGI